MFSVLFLPVILLAEDGNKQFLFRHFILLMFGDYSVNQFRDSTGITPVRFGSLSSQSGLSPRAVPLHPAESAGFIPAWFPTVIGFTLTDGLATRNSYIEADLDSLSVTAHGFAHTGLRHAGCPVITPMPLHGKQVIPW